MSRLSELSGKQQRQLLGAVVGLIVVIVLVVVLAGGGSEKKKDPTLIDLKKIGLQLNAPLTWRRKTQTSTSAELRAPDSTIILALSSPVKGREPAAVKRALERQLKQRYKPAKITDAPGRLGNRKVASFQLRGRLGDRVITVVGLVEDTKFRTYIVTLFTGAPSVRARADARRILRSVKFYEPGKEPS